jgi:hypothetical protein
MPKATPFRFTAPEPLEREIHEQVARAPEQLSLHLIERDVYARTKSGLIDWRGFRVFNDNIPEARPGAYVIQHLTTGRSYVGISHDIRKRLASYVQQQKISHKFKNALRKYGTGAFVVLPVYYSITQECKELPLVEALLIAELNSVGAGYNTKLADERAGPYGPFYGAIISAAMQRPDVKAKRAGYRHSDDTKTRIAAGVKLAHQREETKKRLAETFSSPEFKKRKRAAHRVANARLDVKRKLRIAAEQRVRREGRFA